MTISLPPEMAKEYEGIAKRESKNKSQLFRDMLNAYKERLLEQEFFELQRLQTLFAQARHCLPQMKV
jgi:metal-responsive CopG/Arc/MetJ family transcriptional regulator